ncbi:MAG: hypothetical protein H7831_05685 [Magnetococcus sp. WYHC-3]
MVFDARNLFAGVFAKAVRKIFAIDGERARQWRVRAFADQIADFLGLKRPVQLVGQNLRGGPVFVATLVLFQGAQAAINGFEQKSLSRAIVTYDQVDTAKC